MLITKPQFEQLLRATRLPARYTRDLRFTTSLERYDPALLPDAEMIAITDKSGNQGVLLVDLGQLRLVPFELVRNTATSGRTKSVICDFCTTWRSGSESARIVFPYGRTASSVRFLCCADLRCSEHVRGHTSAAIKSRTQLREDISDDARLQRYRANLQRILDQLDAASF
jgi:hypothetical protein